MSKQTFFRSKISLNGDCPAYETDLVLIKMTRIGEFSKLSYQKGDASYELIEFTSNVGYFISEAGFVIDPSVVTTFHFSSAVVGEHSYTLELIDADSKSVLHTLTSSIEVIKVVKPCVPSLEVPSLVSEIIEDGNTEFTISISLADDCLDYKDTPVRVEIIRDSAGCDFACQK